MKPPSNMPAGMVSGDVVVFWCSYTVDAPLSIEWTFTVAPKRISVPFFTDVLPAEATIVNQGKMALAAVTRPSLLPFHPIALNIFGIDKLSPQASKVVLRPLKNDAKPEPIEMTATDLVPVQLEMENAFSQ
jgi:hypothetical protein